MFSLRWFFLFISVVDFIQINVYLTATTSYRAAVVEFPTIFQENFELKNSMKINAMRYAELTKRAAQKGADLILFPEYGLTGNLENPDRQNVRQFVQEIPKILNWNPCENEKRSEILSLLSCIAKNNSVVLAANLLTDEPCAREEEIICPLDGRFYFNTLVVFSRNGSLIGKYHKKNLFNEEKFLDAGFKTEYSIVDVGFATFGLIICFDQDFFDPLVPLVEKFGVRNILFSGAWHNELPVALAPHFFSSWAHGLGINFLASNQRNPKRGSLGAGIYSSRVDPLQESFDLSAKENLIIADVPLHPLPVRSSHRSVPLCPSNPSLPSTSCSTSTTPASVLTNLPTSHPHSSDHLIYFQPLTDFSVSYLNQFEGEISLSSGRLCCHLQYNLTLDGVSNYALFAFDGFRTFAAHKWPIQACLVLLCETIGDLNSCVRMSKINSKMNIDYLRLKGKFATLAVLPSVLNSELRHVSTNYWEFDRYFDKSSFSWIVQMELFKSKSQILAANLLGIIE